MICSYPENLKTEALHTAVTVHTNKVLSPSIPRFETNIKIHREVIKRRLETAMEENENMIFEVELSIGRFTGVCF